MWKTPMLQHITPMDILWIDSFVCYVTQFQVKGDINMISEWVETFHVSQDHTSNKNTLDF